jgi:hypothetical protein
MATPQPLPPLYFKQRFDLLLLPSFVITTYHAIFLAVVYHYHVITNLKYSWGNPLALQAVGLLFSLGLGYLGVTRDTERVKRNSLVACILLFMFTVSLPIWFWGGSNQSAFSPLLATISGVAVLVTKSQAIRYILAGACILLFAVFSITYTAIILNPGPVLFGLSGVGVYSGLQTFSAIACMVVTLVISRRATVTIFD